MTDSKTAATGKARDEQSGADTGKSTGQYGGRPGHNGGGRLVAPWAPGRSGNPLGVVDLSAYMRARSLCADASPKAAQVQIDLLDDEDPRIRLLAAEAVLSRGVGKPRNHEAEERGNARINLSSLSKEELTSLGGLLKKALGLEASS